MPVLNGIVQPEGALVHRHEAVTGSCGKRYRSGLLEVPLIAMQRTRRPQPRQSTSR